MKIEGWRVDGFGVLRDMEVSDLGSGVTVFLGQNEAGKSTLLAFLRTMLFGFADRRTRENPYPPLAGGRHGGQITLSDEHGLWTFARFKDKPKVITAYGPDGRPGGEEDLRRLLSGVDATLFRSVFAFSLDELQRFATLDAAGVRERIFSAGISGAGQSARAVLAELAAEEGRLLKQRSGKATINDLVRSLQRAEEDVQKAEQEATGYAALARAQDAQRRLADDLDVRLATLAAERRRYEILTALRPDWEELATADRLLAELPAPSGPDLPAAASDLRQRLSILRSREETLHRLRSELASASNELSAHLRHLGPEWTAARLQTVDDSITEQDAVRVWKRRLEQAEVAAEQAERDRRVAREDLTQIADDHDRCSEELPTPTPPSIETLGEREVLVRSLRAQLRDLQMAELQVRAGHGTHTGVWRLAAVSALVALAAALVAAAADAAQLALGLAAGAALLGLVAVLARATTGRAGGGDPTGAAGGIERLRTEVAQTSRRLGLGDDPSEAGLNELEARLSSARDQRVACDGTEAQLRQIARRRALAQGRVAESSRAAEDAESEAEAQRAAWADWAASRDLPDVSPEGMLDLFVEVGQARAAHQSRTKAETVIAAIESERTNWTQEAEAALVEAGMTTAAVSDAALEADVAALDEALAQRTMALERRSGCERRVSSGVSDLPAPEQARRDLAEGDPVLWAAEMERLDAEISETNGARTTAIERRRDAQRAREALEESADVPRLRTELESLRAELALAAHDYRVVMTSAGLVRRTLQSYVRDRQPAVLARASEAFATVTDGRLRAIVQEAADDTDAVLVEQWDGARLTPDELSRGTCEQLYLAIRLALVGEFADRGQELPLIMDDCLVNFDPARAAAMARLIVASASEGQCLFFTCHPDAAALVRRESGERARIMTLPARSCGPGADPSGSTC